MPEGSKVHDVYQALLRDGKDQGTAARIAQAQTGQVLQTGRPPKHARRRRRRYDSGRVAIVPSGNIDITAIKAYLKGYPEFDPDQPRDDSGQFSDSGAGGRKHIDLNTIGAKEFRDFANTRFARFNADVTVKRHGSGDKAGVEFEVYSPTGSVKATYSKHTKTLRPGWMQATDDANGRAFAAQTMLFIRDMALASDVQNIKVQAGMDSGGYVWPRRGFDLDLSTTGARESADYMQAVVRSRLEGLRFHLDPDVYSDVKDMVSDSNWDIGTPTKLAHLDHVLDDSALRAPGVYLTRAEVRGRQVTLGKVLLSRTSAYYTLPRAKFARSGTLAKGYPEYDSHQPRDDNGQWSAEGGGGASGRSGAFDTRAMSDKQIEAEIKSRFPGAIVVVHKRANGKLDINLGYVNQEPIDSGSFLIDPNSKSLKASNVQVADNAAGAKFAIRYMRMLREIAIASGIEEITTTAGLDMGGYMWPRVGFELEASDGGNARLRDAITQRINGLFDRRLITRDEYSAIDGLMRSWDVHTPTKLSQLDRPLKLDSVQIFAITGGRMSTMRGDISVGKALLAGTHGYYRLPRSKFDRLGRLVGKSYGKGYPEYDDSQPRNEDGTWSGGGSGGGGRTVDLSSREGIERQLTARLKNSLAQVQEFGGGYDVKVGDGVNQTTFFIPKGEGKPLTFEGINTADNVAGREWAKQSLLYILDAAEASKAAQIRLEAAGAGGYVWPKMGFELTTPPTGGDPLAYFMKNSGIAERIARAKEIFGGWMGEGRAFNRSLDDITRSGIDTPSKLANLNRSITMDQLRKISGNERYMRDVKLSNPTLGKAFMVGVRGYYALPKEKFDVLRSYVNRTGKALSFNDALAKGFPEYRDDQPRDERGRWGGGSGTSSGGSSRASIARRLLERNVSRQGTTNAADFIASLPKDQQDFIKRSEAKLKGKVPTDASPADGGYRKRNPDGSPGAWLPSRQRLHESIIREYIERAYENGNYPAAGEQPMVLLMGGRGGSGKTSTIERFLGVNPEHHPDFLYLNSDDIKAKLPEYKGWNAGLLHEEASHISDQIERIARDLGFNIIYDATLKSEGSARVRTDTYKDAGYRVEGMFVHTTPQTSATRAMGRAVRTGRFVPPGVILSSTTNEATFDAIKDKFDAWVLFDNNGDFNPKKIGSKGKSRLLR